MQVTEAIILFIYLIVMTVIGIYFYRRARQSESDYFTAGQSINTFVGAFAIFAAVASSSSLMGAVGSGVALGVPYFFTYAFGVIAIMPFAMFLISGQIRRSGAKTMPDFFNQRYGKSVQIVSAVIVVLGMTFYMVPQLTASGLIGSYVLGIDYTTAVIVLGLGFTLYAALGGMWAITYTDLLQGAIMLLGIVVLAAFILVDHSGLSALIDDALAASPSFGDITQPWMSYFGLFIAFLWFGIISPSVVMRNFASRDAKTARRSAMWACLLYLTLFVSGFMVTSAGASLGIIDTLDNTDMIFVSVIEQYLPPILGGIMLAGLMAAIMSSADAMLLAISAGIAHDIYKGHINKQASERFVTGLGLVVMIVASIIGVIIAIDPPGLIAIMVGWVGGFLLSSFGFPLVLGLWWKRANTKGALVGMVGGAVTFLVLIIGQWLPTNAEPIIGAPVSLLLTVIVSLMTEPPSKEIQDRVDYYHTHLEK
ncbi:solute:Na+ symporter, SSS family/sodium/proline symporter/cation/acetate symporter [Oceanobacillus limi]|uniref:Solute:Na+ symporter, SSS family/sodium/proline symporter/cation/acetate symporter n=1 Tax=Oceanobacillus limi TaxID=930131 RepID=A0A1H9Y6C7_9BACI|nr:sodium/solute symporter [Oceanobacillus limi]SES64264.1 solute:Na+ symporter, SSS family/sodium/proline symporter/cation/acetate symporter [Oceanobacillus limi]